MLVNSESTSRLAMNNLESCETISLAKENETLVVSSLDVILDKIGNKNFANLYVGVPIADKMGIYAGKLSMQGLYTI